MNIRLRAVLCFAATALVAKTLAAQSCPGGLANPLNLINNQTWAFETHDGLAGDGMVGILTAQVGNARNGGPTVGTFNATVSYNNAGFTQEQVTVPGTYQINPDCSGGLLIFAISKNGYQYRFYFADNFTKMFLNNASLSTPNQSAGPFAGNRGVATLMAAAPSCAGVAQPLSLLNGTWSFSLEDYESDTNGVFTAQVGTARNGSVPVGVLNGVETTVGMAQQVVEAAVTGTFTINSDCSGGHLFLPTGAASQYAFIFAAPNRMYLVSVSGPGPNGGLFRGNLGQADRF